MSARATLLNFAKRAAKAPVRVTRRNMSGGGTIEEERGACATRGPALTAGRSRSVISDILGFPRGFSHARTVPGWTRASLDSSFASWMPQCGKPRWPNGRYRRRRPSRAGTPGRPVDVSLPHADWTPIQRGVHRTPETDRTRPPLPPRNRAAHMEKWRGVTFLAVPGCIGLGVYLFSNHHEHHAHEQPVRHRPNSLPDPPRALATQRLSKLCVFAQTPD